MCQGDFVVSFRLDAKNVPGLTDDARGDTLLRGWRDACATMGQARPNGVEMGSLVSMLLTLAGLVALLPLSYFAWRSVSKSLNWRFWPGWRRLTCEAAMERYAQTDASGRFLVYEAIPEHRFLIRLRDLQTGSVQEYGSEGTDCRFPRISADGCALEYSEYPSGTWPVGGQERPCRRACVVLRPGGALTAGESSRDPWRSPSTGMEVREERIAVSSLPSSAVSGPSPKGTLRGSTTDGYVGVVVADPAQQRQACLGPGFRPTISADGRFVVFETVQDAYDLEVVDLVAGRRALVCSGNPYPYQAHFIGPKNEIVICCGHLNPLSRTGDCDLFSVDITRIRSQNWSDHPLAWAPCQRTESLSGPADEVGAGTWELRNAGASGASPAQRAAAGAASVQMSAPSSIPPILCCGPGVASASDSAPCETPSVPRNSLWTAGWYFQESGRLKSMAQQDGDGIQVYSERLARFVDHVRQVTGAPRVNLICHCMGGLVAKGMIQYWHDGEYGFSGLDGSPGHSKIQHLVTLASPLRGNSLFGLLPAVRALKVPYYRHGFTQQAYDMTRGSEFLARLNQGEAWQQKMEGHPGSCYKPIGREAPPYYHSFTGDGYFFMDGAVTHDATRCAGIPGSSILLAADEEGIVSEGEDGRWIGPSELDATPNLPRRRMVHVPEDVILSYVTEDKCKAVTHWILEHLEGDLPIIFVHGSFLFRGFADLSWRVVTHRLTGEVRGFHPAFVRGDSVSLSS